VFRSSLPGQPIPATAATAARVVIGDTLVAHRSLLIADNKIGRRRRHRRQGFSFLRCLYEGLRITFLT
jgi:hypothetical protein